MARLKLGLISDTHNLLRPEAMQALKGVDGILHLGDIGHSRILVELSKIAPVTAVRGNNDRDAWADTLPEWRQLELLHHRLYLIHDLKNMDLDPVAAGVKVVLSGHSHRPSVHWERGILYVNPGSAGPRRFKLPITVGYLILDGDDIRADIIELELPVPAGR